MFYVSLFSFFFKNPLRPRRNKTAAETTVWSEKLTYQIAGFFDLQGFSKLQVVSYRYITEVLSQRSEQSETKEKKKEAPK